MERQPGSDRVAGVPEQQAPQHTELRTFLIADVRGYTSFTAERGDEAAGRLAARFAELTRVVVAEHGGRLLELRGDEALVVFGSARSAIRAALGLQDGYVEHTLADPALPLPVGIGLDAGEAVPVEGGYRGGALNLAARLCALAGPGEVLASQEVAHLARRLDGVRYADRGRVAVKGLAEPAPVVAVLPETVDLPQQRAFQAAVRRPAPPRWTGRRLIAAGAVVVLLAGVALVAGWRATRPDAPRPVRLAGNSLALLDPARGRLLADMPVGANPAGVTVGGGWVWVANAGDDSVSRLDVRGSGTPQTYRVGGAPVALAVAGGFVWVVNSGDGTVSRISIAGNRVVDEPPIAVGNGPVAIAANLDGVWVADGGDDQVRRLDPVTGAPGRAVGVGDQPAGLASEPHGLWVTNYRDATLSHLDTRTGTVTTVNVGVGPIGVTLTGSSVWVANSLAGNVTAVDRASGRVTATVDAGNGPREIATVGERVWAGAEYGALLAEIRGQEGQASPAPGRRLGLGNAPRGLAAAPGGTLLWVAVRDAGLGAHRGGTLTVRLLPFNIDPALDYTDYTTRFLSVVYDSLLTYDRAGGADSYSLVPDLADAVPRPQDGGRTWVFHLRPGIRYSDGRYVQASDFRRGLEREFVVGPAGGNPRLYSAISGAGRCLTKPATKMCDLSAGVVADDRADTVTFRLSRPDYDLPYKLALPFASATAPGAPMHDVGHRPLPGTGPYRIASSTGGVFNPPGRIVLTRNPYFREWSHSAQPAGYPDRITGRMGPPSDAEDKSELNDVLAGRADVYLGPPPAARLPDLQARYPNLVHASVGSFLIAVVLNQGLSPFNDVRARRALNLAVDRAAITRAVRGPLGARPTCQILPVNFPGYQPYCPYRRAPELAAARRLVIQSGTKGQTVRYLSFGGPDPLAGALVRALNLIGYHASRRVARGGAYQALTTNPGRRVQLFPVGWGADYPTPAGFIGGSLTCGSSSWSRFCDPRVDRLIAAAQAEQFSDPAAAREAGARADRLITDAAPWVPLYNAGTVDLVSARVGHYQYHPLLGGAVLSQLWVR